MWGRARVGLLFAAEGFGSGLNGQQIRQVLSVA